MEINNENYQVFLNHPIGDIPKEELTQILKELMVNAMFYMNTSLEDTSTKTTREGIYYILKNEFGYMPLYLVGQAFMQGSLGKLGGTTKFTVRNVHIWLSALKEQYQRMKMQERSKDDQRRKMEEEKRWKTSYMDDNIFGTALCIKLAWNFTGAIDPKDWDEYSLDAIVVHLRAGETEKTIKPSMIKR